MLPLLNLTNINTLTIDGSNNGNQIVLDGNSLRVFFASQGTVAINNITIQNTLAKGGNGGASGGGMGSGSALFID